MAEISIGFWIWFIFGVLFIALGIRSFFSKKAAGFWANVEMFQVTDIKQYNRAVGKLFCVFGTVFIFLGFPLLSEQNSAWILFSVFGVMFESIIAMVIYSTVIEKKYNKENKKPEKGEDL